MSFLELRSPTGENVKLNCVSFTTSMSGLISSAQTKTMLQHFPVKAEQPAVEFDIVFRNEKNFEDFQKIVRNHHLAALNSWLNPEITLSWPERNINNWTGIIKNFRVGGAKSNFVPRAKLTVDLIDSVYSMRTQIASMAASFWTIAGYGSPAGMFIDDLIGRDIFALPNLPETELSERMSGTDGTAR